MESTPVISCTPTPSTARLVHVSLIAAQLAPVACVLAAMPADCAMSFSVLLLDAGLALQAPLSEQLSASIGLPVRLAEPGQSMAAGTVYLLPVWPSLSLNRQRVVAPAAASGGRRGWDIADAWMRSLAIEAGADARVLLLDGGAEPLPPGALRIGMAGGHVLRAPQDAPAPSWAGVYYEELPVAAMPARLMQLTGGDPASTTLPVTPMLVQSAPDPALLASENAALQARMQALDEVVDDAGIAIVMLDAQLRVVWFSAGAQRYFNLMPHDIGQPLAHISTDLVHDDFAGLLRQAHAASHPTEIEIRQRRDGSRHRLRLRPAGGTEGDGQLALTLREAPMLASSDEADAAAREELAAFAYAVSHDLQEPVRMVVSFSELLERRYRAALGQQSVEAQRYLGVMHDGAVRLRAMLDAMLTYSRLTSRRRPHADVALATMLKTVLTAIQSRIDGSAADISVGDLPVVRGDAVQLEWLFRELLTNALKFASVAPPRVRVAARQSAPHRWELSVTDDGIGIPEGRQEAVFGLFKRGAGTAGIEGVGAGLAIARHVVRLHGGTIGIRSSEGQGTILSFTLSSAEGGAQA